MKWMCLHSTWEWLPLTTTSTTRPLVCKSLFSTVFKSALYRIPLSGPHKIKTTSLWGTSFYQPYIISLFILYTQHLSNKRPSFGSGHWDHFWTVLKVVLKLRFSVFPERTRAQPMCRHSLTEHVLICLNFTQFMRILRGVCTL